MSVSNEQLSRWLAKWHEGIAPAASYELQALMQQNETAGIPRREKAEKNVVSEAREVYGQALDRNAHGTGHYEGCWKDHWACLTEKLLDHIARIESEKTK
jgi:hypothetical protein